MAGHVRNRKTSGEEFIAERIQREREARGWTFRQLSDALRELPEDLQFEIDPSGLHKIENPTAEGRRRRITVDEALSFSAVFGIPLGELIASPDERNFMKFMDAVDTLTQVRNKRSDYVETLTYIRGRVEASAELRDRIARYAGEARAEMISHLGGRARRNHRSPDQGKVLEDRLKREASPAMVAAHDALSDDPLVNTEWNTLDSPAPLGLSDTNTTTKDQP